MTKFSDSSYNILKQYFDVLKDPRTGDDSSYILSQNHTIVADGGVFTKLYQENDQKDMIAHNFRIIEINDNNFVFKYEGIASTHSEVTALEVDKEMYFRKDEKFRDFLIQNSDLYEDHINTNKLFIYFGKIYPVADNTGQVGINYNIKFEGMKNFVTEALPENNRNGNLDEFIAIYYDQVAHEIYNMTKTLWSFIDAKEVNLKHLDYLATRAGLSIKEDLLPELPLREFVDHLPYWMKRKSSYASYYIVHKVLLENTRNVLNIYERWAEWCLRDLRGDKAWTLPTDYQTHHIAQHYGAHVSGGAGPLYYDQWNEVGTDFQEVKVLSPKNTATATCCEINDTINWTGVNATLTTAEREGERWAMRVLSTQASGYATSEPFQMVRGHEYHLEYDAGAERYNGGQWQIRIETALGALGRLVEGDEHVLNGDMALSPAQYWYPVGTPTAFGQSAAQAHDGVYSWTFAVSAADAGMKSEPFLTFINREYRGSLWVVSWTSPSVDVIVRNGDDTADNWNQSYPLATGVWTEIQFDYFETTTGPDATIQVTSGVEVTGTWYTDEISVVNLVDYSDEIAYQSNVHRGYGNRYPSEGLMNSYQTSGAEFTCKVTDDTYRLKLLGVNTDGAAYFDNVYLCDVGTPKTGYPNHYPTYSEAPTADCRANSWNFGDRLYQGNFTTSYDPDTVIAGEYSNIFQVDALTPSASFYSWKASPVVPDYTSAQTPSAAGGEYNLYSHVSMDSRSKPSGSMAVMGMFGESPDGYLGIQLEYELRHRDGAFTDGTPPYTGSATDGPARRFKISKFYDGVKTSMATSGDFYRADTEYHCGLHVITKPFDPVHIATSYIDIPQVSAGDIQYGYVDSNSEPDYSYLVNGTTDSDGFRTNTALPGANIDFDFGQGNDQAISMLRMYRYGTTGTTPLFDMEASHDGFSVPSATVCMTPDIEMADLGWNKQAWRNTDAYRFWRLILTNTPGVNSGYSEIELYTGDSTIKPELRANIYRNDRMKNPVDLIETIRMPLDDHRKYEGVYISDNNSLADGSIPRQVASQSAVPSADIYYDLQDWSMSGGYTRSIAPTGNLVLTPHYKVELDLSSEAMGNEEGYRSIINVGQAEEIIRYWNFFKPVDKFVEHHFLISPIGKLDELNESVSLYDPLDLGICDTRFIGTQTLAATGTPVNPTLIENSNFLESVRPWTSVVTDTNEPASAATVITHLTNTGFEASGAMHFNVHTAYEGVKSSLFDMTLGTEYGFQFMCTPASANGGQGGNITVGVRNGDDTGWAYLTDFTDMLVADWNKVEGSFREDVGGPSRIQIMSNSSQTSGAWIIDDVYFTSGKQDLFQQTAVEKRTYASSEWPIAHNLNNIGVMTQIFDPDENILYPKRLEILDSNRVRAHFNAGQRGRAFTAGTKGQGKRSYTQFISPAASAWDITHNLGTSGASGVCYQVYNADLSSNIVPQDVQRIDINNLQVTFPLPVSGYCFVRDDDFYHEQLSAETTWHVDHGVNARGLICHAYDHNGFRQYPETIEMVDYDTARIDWAEPVSGTACFLFFQREFTDADFLLSLGVSAGPHKEPLGFWKIGDGDTLGFNPLVANNLDSVTASGAIDEILVTSDQPSGQILVNFSVPKWDPYTISEMGVFDKDKNLQYYTKTGELHKPADVQLDVRYRIDKLPTRI